jgi:hypothetical protein
MLYGGNTVFSLVLLLIKLILIDMAKVDSFYCRDDSTWSTDLMRLRSREQIPSHWPNLRISDHGRFPPLTLNRQSCPFCRIRNDSHGLIAQIIPHQYFKIKSIPREMIVTPGETGDMVYMREEDNEEILRLRKNRAPCNSHTSAMQRYSIEPAARLQGNRRKEQWRLLEDCIYTKIGETLDQKSIYVPFSYFYKGDKRFMERDAEERRRLKREVCATWSRERGTECIFDDVENF